MNPQPLIAVCDIEASSRWYQSMLGCKSGHGGTEYERIHYKDKLILQIHRWDAHDHPHMGNPRLKSRGNGVLLRFQVEDSDAAIKRSKAAQAEILQGPLVNTNANHREIWLRDPDGYVVVIAGHSGDLGSRKPSKTMAHQRKMLK